MKRVQAAAWRNVCGRISISGLVTLLVCVLGSVAPLQAQEPIKIGFGVSLTGGLASSGKAHLLSKQIWAEEINAKGGLLGRQVRLIYFDDQTNAANVPGIYSKLMDVDKVDLLMGHATNLIVAAMPHIMARKKMVMVLLALGSNAEFTYPKYFQSAPFGPDSKGVLSNAFFEVAKSIKPAPKTVALVGADAEFSNNVLIGARENAKKFNLRIVYDRSYPPATIDYSPIVRAIQVTNPDLLVICSYPLDTVGMIKAMGEVGFKPKMWGGAMVGLQATVFKTQLGPLLNGIVNFETWLPVKSMDFPGSAELLKKYQARAQAAGTDPLGYYMPVWAYAYLQVLGDAVAATKSLNDDVLADYVRKTTFKTVVGDIKFGKQGEWAEERTLAAQFQNIKGKALDDFRDLTTEVIIYPPKYKSGEVIYPYEKAIVK